MARKSENLTKKSVNLEKKIENSDTNKGFENVNLIDKFMDLDFQRKSAKVLMATSLGGLCLTAFGKGKVCKNLHKIFGISLVGGALWHHNLYKTRYSKYLKERKEAKNDHFKPIG